MKQIEFHAGCNLEKAWHMLQQETEKSGEPCCGEFNGKTLLSTETLDEAYMKVTGKTKAEHDAHVQQWLDEQKHQREEHEARIPKLTEMYRQNARGLVLDDTLEYWDKIVPIRLGDLYRGMELGNVLDCCRVMRDKSLNREERLRKAYGIFNDAGHSGNSAALTMAMLRKFCPDGNELADACNEFRYAKDHKTCIFVARNPDGELYLHFAYPVWRNDGTFFSPNAVKLNPLQFPEVKAGVRVEYKAGEAFDTNRK